MSITLITSAEIVGLLLGVVIVFTAKGNDRFGLIAGSTLTAVCALALIVG